MGKYSKLKQLLEVTSSWNKTRNNTFIKKRRNFL